MTTRSGRPDRGARRRLLAELGFTRPVSRDWRTDAACVGEDPELFYPEVGTAAQISAQTAQAKRVCAVCPVRSACLAEVMATEDPAMRWGITGGLSASERLALFAARRDGAGEVA